MSIELKSKKNKDEVEMVELFTIDDVSYYVPNKIRVNLQLNYLKILREEGMDVAIAYLMTEILGEEAYEALMNFEDLTQEDLDSVQLVAMKIATGMSEEEVKKALSSGKAPAKTSEKKRKS